MLVSTFNDGIIEINSEEITEDNIQDLAKINTEKINTKLEKINNEQLQLIPKVQEYIQYMLETLIKLPRTEKFSIGTEYKKSVY